MITEKKTIGQTAYEKGYRYHLSFHEDSGLTGLYVKSVKQASQLLQEDFRVEMCRGGWVLNRIATDGEFVC